MEIIAKLLLGTLILAGVALIIRGISLSLEALLTFYDGHKERVLVFWMIVAAILLIWLVGSLAWEVWIPGLREWIG